MGHDGYLELGDTLILYADPRSTRYADQIEEGIIDPEKPIYTYVPGQEGVDRFKPRAAHKILDDHMICLVTKIGIKITFDDGSEESGCLGRPRSSLIP